MHGQQNIKNWLKTVLRDGEFSTSTSRCPPAIYYQRRNGPPCSLQYMHLLLSVKRYSTEAIRVNLKCLDNMQE